MGIKILNGHIFFKLALILILFAIQISLRLDVFCYSCKVSILQGHSHELNSYREKYRYKMYRNMYCNTGFLYRNISQYAFWRIVAPLVTNMSMIICKYRSCDIACPPIFLLMHVLLNRQFRDDPTNLTHGRISRDFQYI